MPNYGGDNKIKKVASAAFFYWNLSASSMRRSRVLFSERRNFVRSDFREHISKYVRWNCARSISKDLLKKLIISFRSVVP